MEKSPKWLLISCQILLFCTRKWKAICWENLAVYQISLRVFSLHLFNYLSFCQNTKLTHDKNVLYILWSENSPKKIRILIYHASSTSCWHNIMMVWAKRIYILMIRVNKFLLQCFLKEIENMVFVFLFSCRKQLSVIILMINKLYSCFTVVLF